MTKPIDPYSRIYWKVLHDDRFKDVRSDMRHFGSWSLMLVVADMAYPAPAFVPPTVPRASLRLLASEECGLVELLGGGLFRVRGMKAERERRWNPRGTAPEPERTPTGPAAEPERVLVRATDETRQDETRSSQDRDENRAPELGPSEDETAVFAAIAQAGAFIRPESGLGVRIIGLIARQGAESVVAELATMTAKSKRPLSDRQIVLGLENVMETIPTAAEARVEDIDEQRQKRGNRIAEQMHTRRVEAFHFTGYWEDAWGPVPEPVTA